MEGKKIPRTERILSIYHLFTHCKEVSYKEVTDQIPSVSRKTVARDIKLLRDAGVLQTKYSRKTNAFIPLNIGEVTEPILPEEKGQRTYPEKIRRLCILMNAMIEELDGVCDERPLHMELHERLFPEVSKRTRQRDFSTLDNIGYSVRHYEDEVDDENAEEGWAVKWVYCFEAPQTYELRTFNEREW